MRCWQGTVFFAFVLDVYSRRIVGWQFASHMRAPLVVNVLPMALATRERVAHVELIHHSDKGSQYTSSDVAAVLAEYDGPAHWADRISRAVPSASFCNSSFHMSQAGFDGHGPKFAWGEESV